MTNVITTGNTAQTALVPVFTGTLQSQTVQLCDARALHTFMGVLRDFSNWIKGRIRKFDFVEGVDYLTVTGEVVAKSGENLGGRPSVDYHLSLNMAKELSMVENNAKGKEARRYFIACEQMAIVGMPAQALNEPGPAQQPVAIDTNLLTALIAGGMFNDKAMIDLAKAINFRQFATACHNPHRGYGAEVADKITTLSWADLHAINVAASLEVWKRTLAEAK